MSRATARSAAHRARWLVGLALALVACATPPEPVHWAKEGASETDLEQARTECTEQALASDAPTDRYAYAVRGGAFMRCMRDKGWEQVQGDP